MIKQIKRVLTGGVLALMCMSLGVGIGMIAFRSVTVVQAQSARRGGSDVPVIPFEQWFKRIGLLNSNGGCDIALEYNALNQARFTDCTDSANLRDVIVRSVTQTQANELLGGSAVGGALTQYDLLKEVTGIADATFTDVITITVPNAAHSATIPIVINARLGAGGAIGADECTGTAYGQVVVTRTAGVNAVATATTLADTGSACVAGATTIATAYQMSAVTGTVSAVNTFTIQVRVTKGGGSSANHKVDVAASLLNANATGITIS